jgi:hypothetical protein
MQLNAESALRRRTPKGGRRPPGAVKSRPQAKRARLAPRRLGEGGRSFSTHGICTEANEGNEASFRLRGLRSLRSLLFDGLEFDFGGGSAALATLWQENRLQKYANIGSDRSSPRRFCWRAGLRPGQRTTRRPSLHLRLRPPAAVRNIRQITLKVARTPQPRPLPP